MYEVEINDQDKGGLIPSLSLDQDQIQHRQPPKTLFKDETDGNLSAEPQFKEAKPKYPIEEFKISSTSQTEKNVVDMQIGSLKRDPSVGEDFVQINDSEVNQIKKEEEQQIASYQDMGLDSYYPLVTEDPKKKKEYVLKITDTHLNNVFGSGKNENSQFNLQSIIIQDNYIGTGQKREND